METENLQTLIQIRLEELPEPVRKAIDTSNWKEKVLAVAKKNNLRVDQGAALENEVYLIMLGLIHPNEFISNIIRECSIDESTAKIIASDIENQILSDIKTLLIELVEQEDLEAEDDAPPEKNEEIQIDQAESERQEMLKTIQEDSVVKTDLPMVITNQTATNPLQKDLPPKIDIQLNTSKRITPIEKKIDPYLEPIE